MSDWSPSDDDRHLLAGLIDAARAMSTKAVRGQGLIAAGEVWDALERIRDGEPIEVDTELTVGVRRGDRDAEEGIFVSIRVNADEIVLDRMTTSYSRAVGSDRETETIARLSPDEPFDDVAVEDWFEMLRALLSEPDSTLTASRDHL